MRATSRLRRRGGELCWKGTEGRYWLFTTWMHCEITSHKLGRLPGLLEKKEADGQRLISRRADWRSAALSLITPPAGGSPGVCHLTYLPPSTSPHLPCCLCHVGLSTSPLCWESKAAFMPASFSPVELRSRLPPLCSWFELCECCNHSPRANQKWRRQLDLFEREVSLHIQRKALSNKRSPCPRWNKNNLFLLFCFKKFSSVANWEWFVHVAPQRMLKITCQVHKMALTQNYIIQWGHGERALNSFDVNKHRKNSEKRGQQWWIWMKQEKGVISVDPRQGRNTP